MAGDRTVPQEALDALTDVGMPRGVPAPAAHRDMNISGMRIPVHRRDALVLGSGAAGLRAAVELRRRGVDVLVATQILFWGKNSANFCNFPITLELLVFLK